MLARGALSVERTTIFLLEQAIVIVSLLNRLVQRGLGGFLLVGFPYKSLCTCGFSCGMSMHVVLNCVFHFAD